MERTKAYFSVVPSSVHVLTAEYTIPKVFLLVLIVNVPAFSSAYSCSTAIIRQYLPTLTADTSFEMPA